MFQSTKAFDKAMRDVLINFRDDNAGERSELSENQYIQVVRRALDLGYIQGVSFIKTMGGPASGTPKILSDAGITYDGLVFIENFE